MVSRLSLKVGEIITLELHGFTHDGDGVGRYGGAAVFVTGGIPGEQVKAIVRQIKKNYAIADLVEVITPHSARLIPDCSVYGNCGGCRLKHIAYEKQLQLKTMVVKDNLERIGGLSNVPVKPIIGMDYPYHYRNKVEFHVTEEKGGLKFGFFAPGSYNLTGVAECNLFPGEFNRIADFISSIACNYGITAYQYQTRKGILRNLVIKKGFNTGEIMVILVTASKNLPGGGEIAEQLMKEFPEVVSVYHNINPKGTSEVLGRENRLLGGKEKIREELMGYVFEISPLSFFQVNPVQTRVLYEKVLEYSNLTGDETVVDLYCGLGSITLPLSSRAKKVVGVEVVPDAVVDARSNAALNGVTNVEFFAGAAEKLLPQWAASGLTADVVVVDPPRKGCDKEVLEAIAAAGAARVVYVSCNPATLARDLRILKGLGYETGEVQPVDMFPHTSHVESIVLMTNSGLKGK